MDTNPMMTVTPVKAPPYLTKNPMVTLNGKSDSEPESDSEESESSEKSDPESSEDAKFMPDNLEELKAAFRDLYKRFTTTWQITTNLFQYQISCIM